MLWSTESYDARWALTENVYRFGGFSCISTTLLLLVIVYVYRLITDIHSYHNGDLGKKEQHKKILQRSQHTLHNTTRSKSNLFANNCIIEFVRKVYHWYRHHFKVDTGAWCAQKLGTEMFEIFVQTVALMYYNGYILMNSNDDDIALAYKSEYIILFVIFLSMNCIFSCIIWLFYAFRPLICHGLVFELVLYAADVIFDIFYAVFPLIVVFQATEDNTNNIQVALGSLQTDDSLRNCFLCYYHHL